MNIDERRRAASGLRFAACGVWWTENRNQRSGSRDQGPEILDIQIFIGFHGLKFLEELKGLCRDQRPGIRYQRVAGFLNGFSLPEFY